MDDDAPSCPFLGCLNPGREWFHIPNGEPKDGFAGIPPKFRVCAKHKEFLERVSAAFERGARPATSTMDRVIKLDKELAEAIARLEIELDNDYCLCPHHLAHIECGKECDECEARK